MCRRIKLWGMISLAIGIGLLLSGVLGSVILRLLIGILLVLIGLYLINN